MLTVAVEANHVVESQLKRQFVTRLHATTQTEVHGKPDHIGAGLFRHRRGSVTRIVVDDEDRHAGRRFMYRADDLSHGSFLVERRNDNRQPYRFHAWARSFAVIRCARINRVNSAGCSRRLRRKAARFRSSAGKCSRVSQ